MELARLDAAGLLGKTVVVIPPAGAPPEVLARWRRFTDLIADTPAGRRLAELNASHVLAVGFAAGDGQPVCLTGRDRSRAAYAAAMAVATRSVVTRATA